MKKSLFYTVMSAAAFAACTSDDVISNRPLTQQTMVTFSVDMPSEMATRAVTPNIGLGHNIDKLHFIVYNADNVARLDSTMDAFAGDNTTQKVNIPLVTGETYKIVFWAYANGAPYTLNSDGTVTIDYTNPAANDENRDAFYTCADIKVNQGEGSKSVKLTRPFAQLNIGTTDQDVHDASTMFGLTNLDGLKTQVTLTGDIYTTLDLKTGEVSNPLSEGEVSYVLAQRPLETLETTKGSFNYLSLCYVLTDDAGDVMKVNFSTDQTTVAREYLNIPLRRNYRTNILGSILTTTTEFTVDVAPAFAGETWLGEIDDPVQVDPQNLTVSTPQQLAGLAKMVQDGDDLMGKTITLDGDIDLAGHTWTPIGTSGKPFKGNFDGQGHTISNLVIEGNDSEVGLFGYTPGSGNEIKNIVIENASVKGYLNVGVLSGTPYTTAYSNITLKGLIQVDGFAYVGAVFGKNSYANLTDISVDAAPGSYVKAISDAGGTAYRTYVGGVCGFNGEGSQKYENIHSNIDVIGSTCDVGGLFGIAHYNNKFVNCSSSGNVTLLRATDDSDFREIGGIAGVWHNESGTTVSFDGCSFTGTLTSKMEDGTDRSAEILANTIVGKPYNSSGTGKLIIDGVEQIGKSNFAAAIAGVSDGGTVQLMAADIDMKGISFPNGKTFTLEGQGDNTVLDLSGFGYNQYVTMADCNVTFKNLKIKFSNNTYVAIEAHTKSSHFENCTIEGTMYVVGADATSVFDNCRFVQTKNDAYNIWTSWGAASATFNDCEFYSDSKSVLVYRDGGGQAEVTFNRCKFYGKSDPDNKDKAAIQVHNSPGGAHFTVNINSCEVQGFGTETKSGSMLWSTRKSENSSNATIYVDGAQVYDGDGK